MMITVPTLPPIAPKCGHGSRDVPRYICKPLTPSSLEMRKTLMLSLAIVAATVAVGYTSSALVCYDGAPSESISATAPTSAATETVHIYYDVPLSRDLQDYIIDLCKVNNISPELVLAIIKVESNYCATAVNASESCYGLMQINRCNFAAYQLDEPTDDFENVRVGITIFAEQLDKHGDVNKALMAYNCGPTGAKRLWEQGITETSYCRKVAAAKQEIIGKERVYVVKAD